MTNFPVVDYFQRTNKAPKKREREQILAHLKELGDPEVTDIRIVNWFNQTRRGERLRPPPPLPLSASDLTDTKWVDVHHETRKSSILPSIIPSKSSDFAR